MGIADELTAAFVLDSMFWGCVRLYRNRGRPDFDVAEASFVAGISPALAEGFRRALLASALAVHDAVGGPGVIVLDHRDEVEAMSVTAEHWLREIIDVPLTDRERDVLQRLVQGLSTKEIAAAIELSVYTVADHLKRIFEKVGVRSRTELLAHLFFDHYYPRLLRGDVPASDGWFAEPG